jgi:gliding motility-associated-like protein
VVFDLFHPYAIFNMKQNVLLMDKRLFLTIFFPIFLCCSNLLAQGGFFLQDSLTLKQKNCTGNVDFCFDGISQGVTQGLQITVDGKAIPSPFTSCKSDTIFQYTVQDIDAALAPYRIDSVRIGAKKYINVLFASAQALTDSLNKWDPVAKWTYDSATKRISGTPLLKYSAIAYTIVNSSLSNKIGLNSSIIPKGIKLSFDRGTHKVVASGGIPLVKDSIYIIIACSKTNFASKTVTVGKNDNYCASPSLLPNKIVVGFTPLSPLKNAKAEYAAGTGDSCITIKPLTAGKDTFQFILRGTGGINDTTVLYLTINPSVATSKGGKHEVTQFVGEGKSIQYCIKTDDLLPNATDSIKSVTNYCAGFAGKDATFTITGKNKCIKIDGIKAGGIDTACIVITNQKDQKDTTIIYAYVTKDCKSLIAIEQVISFTDDCLAKGEVCIPKFRNGSDSTKYNVFVDGTIYKGVTSTCDDEDVSGISYVNLFDDASGKILPFPFTVESWGINGQKFSNGGLVNSLEDIVTVLNKWNPAGNWKLDTLNRFFRGGDKKNKYDNLYLINQVVFTEHLALFNFGTRSNGTLFYFNKGIRNVVVFEKATGCADTVVAVVHCAKAKVINTEIFINQKDTLCIDLTSLVGKNITITNNPKIGANVAFSPSADKKCVYFTGTKLGKDSIVLIACDEFKICDTTYLYVEVVPRSKNRVVYDTININGSGKYCIDTLFATDKIKSFINISTQSGTSAIFVLDNKTKCVQYTGTATVGADTAKVVICDEKNVCDTTTVIVIVRKPVIPNPVSDIVRDTVVIGGSTIYCLPKGKFDLPFTSPLSVKNICEKTTNKDVTFTIQQTSQCNGANNFGYALIYTGVKIGTDTACVEVTDASGKKDTLRVLVTVIPRTKFVFRDTILEGNSGTYCINVGKLNVKGVLDSAYNICPTRSGKEVTFKIERIVNCLSGYGVRYTGLKVGTDTACVVVKDKLGNSDTFPAYVTVKAIIKQPKIIYDTVYTFQTKRYCVDPAQLKLTGGIDSVWNLSAKTSKNKVVFVFDRKQACTTINGKPGVTVYYTGGDERGTDTACYVMADNVGALDTIKFIVTVRLPSPSFLSDKVEVGKTITLCADTTQLFGKIKSVKNICPTKGGQDAKFTIDTLTGCVKIEGLKIGKDTACIVICSEFDVCDTTTMYIEVVPVGSIVTLDAIDDIDSTTYPKPIIINILNNDKYDIKDTAKIQIKILAGKEPKHGVAIVDPKTRKIQYVPDPNTKYCGKDTFYYSIKVDSKIDTARVIVTIKCEKEDKGPYKVYNAFTPNGDNKNDTFTITGLGNYPDNELIIYNRWGNQVFRMKNYDNSWDGLWDGHELPDGTYYYVLCLPDNGTTKIESGYLELRR